MLLTNTISRSEDFARQRVLARPEFPLREHHVHSSNACQLIQKPLAPVMRLACRAVARGALLGSDSILAFEPAP